MKGSPLLGYNNNVRHKGKLYHIQTEDSGLKHPHIITHLFADGGRIISSKKTSYAEHVGSDDCKQIVKKMMQEQHKAMFIALKAGELDEDMGDEGPPSSEHRIDTVPGTHSAPDPSEERVVDVEALERAASRLSGPQPTATEHAPMYQATRPARPERRSDPAPESIFGKDLLSEKSLDEVILSYLAEDLEDTE